MPTHLSVQGAVSELLRTRGQLTLEISCIEHGIDLRFQQYPRSCRCDLRESADQYITLPHRNIRLLTNPATESIPMRHTAKPKAVAHHSIWLVSTFTYFPLQTHSVGSSASIARGGKAVLGSAMCKGSVRSKTSPCAHVKNLRCAVSVSSMCHSFICI